MEQKMNYQNYNKNLYVTDYGVYDSCPHCGFVFDWQRWRSTERRLFVRFKKATPITMEMYDQIILKTLIEDISRRGMGITTPVHFPAKTGDHVRCSFGHNNKMRAMKVVWSKKDKCTNKLGLLFIKRGVNWFRH